ncbi:DUF7503 family protein [Haloarcula pellucida]
MSDTTMREFLAEHPRMAGALFTILLLLTQAGGAMAGNNASIAGP